MFISSLVLYINYLNGTLVYAFLLVWDNFSRAIPGNLSIFQKFCQLWHSRPIIVIYERYIVVKVCFYASMIREVLELRGRVCGSEMLPTVKEDQIRDSLSKLD